MKKADNFNVSKWLVENKITTQSRLNENKIPGIDVEADDDMITLSGDSGDYDGFIEDNGTVSFSLTSHYLDKEEFNDQNWKDILGDDHVFVKIANAIDTKVEALDDYVMITVKASDLTNMNEALAGHMGAVSSATKNAKSPSGDSVSDKPDEFSLSILVNPMYKRYANYNYKLKDVEFEKAKAQEGFLSNIFSSSPTIKFIFNKVADGKEATIQIKLKNDEFVLNNSSTSSEDVGTIPDSGEATKFINYLLGQSQWKDDLSKSFENIKDKLKPSSFK